MKALSRSHETPNALMENPNVLMEHPNALMENPNVLMDNPNAFIGNPNFVEGSSGCRNPWEFIDVPPSRPLLSLKAFSRENLQESNTLGK